MKTKIKSHLGFLENIKILDLKAEHIDDILMLIEQIYGEEYLDKEFYSRKILNKYLEDSRDTPKSKTFWKGAFYQNKLIGQMLFVAKHGAGFLLLTMVDKDFQEQGIITLLSSEMVKMHHYLKPSDMRCTYAFVNKNNSSMITVLENFNFVKLGTLPKHKQGNDFLIYGRIFKDFNWRMVYPYLNLSPKIFKIIKSNNLRRIISTHSRSLLSSKTVEIEINVKYIEEDYFKKTIFYSDIGIIYAEIKEHKFQNYWFDFRFCTDNLNFSIKNKIIKLVIDNFKKTNDINSLSLLIDENDIESQRILMTMDVKFHAYLPFYYNEKDKLLFGISKIKEGGEFS